MQDEHDVRERLARTLRIHREQLGLTQRDLAERSGVSSGTVSRIETEQLSPSLDTLAKLASGLDLDLTTMVAEVAGVSGRMRSSYRVNAGTWTAMSHELLGQILADVGDRARAAAALGLTPAKLARLLAA